LVAQESWPRRHKADGGQEGMPWRAEGDRFMTCTHGLGGPCYGGMCLGGPCYGGMCLGGLCDGGLGPPTKRKSSGTVPGFFPAQEPWPRRRVVRANSRRKRVLLDLLATPLVASRILTLSFEPVANLIESTDQPRSTCLPKLRVAL